MGRYAVAVCALLVAGALAGCAKKGKPAPPAPPSPSAEKAAEKPTAKTARVTAGPLNLRDKPGLDGGVIGRLSEGEKVVVHGKSAAAETIDGKAAYWYDVETIDKKRGWTFGAYLDLEAAGGPAAGTASAAEAAADAPLPPINVTAAAAVPGWKADDYFQRGQELAEAKEYGEALFYYKAATERSPQTAPYWFAFGLALQELSRHAEAATAYERAVTLKADDFWAHNNLGLACIRARRPRRAVEVLEKALTLEPKGRMDPKAAKDVARKNLATAYELNGQPEKAAALR